MAYSPEFNQKYKSLNLRTDEYFSEYDIGQLYYPTGLGTDPDLQHYVAFFINVRGKSKFDTEKDQRSKTAITPSGANLKSEDISVKTQIAAGGAAAAVAAGVYGIVEGRAKKAGRAAAKITAATGAAIAALAAGQSIAGNLLEPDKSYRIKDVITLHVENSPATKYGINYQNPDLGTLTGFLAGGGASAETVETFEFAKQAAAIAAINIAALPASVGGTKISDLIGVSARVKTNPFTETLFESVDFRSFQFNYRFLPNDPSETNRIQEIIKKFKEHMHPTLSDSTLFYIYPSEFEIVYYYKGKENSFVHKISRCALTDMGVTYGGDQFSTFDDGAPTEYNLTLTFRELELLDRRRIREGF